MKIILTESQYQKLTEEKLREFLYGFWNNQKKHGENPSLDDMLYKVLGLNKETREDYDTIRPLWYNYNGGFDKLYNKVKNEIDTKEYNLNQDLFNFLDLQIVKDWRRMLDDEYVSPFILDGKRWKTVEHYYQACKFKKRFSNFYASFSLDSKSEICENVKKANV
jgi:hypothetical protein